MWSVNHYCYRHQLALSLCLIIFVDVQLFWFCDRYVTGKFISLLKINSITEIFEDPLFSCSI